MFVQSAGGRYEIRSRYIRGLTSSVFAFFALLVVGGFVNTTRTAFAMTVVLEIILVALVARGWRSASVIVDDQEVVVRSLLRTRKWPRRAIRGFVADTRAVGMGGWQRRVLGIAFTDGSTRWLNEINSRPPKEGASTWIDEAVSVINKP
jgi:hypothetical protein